MKVLLDFLRNRLRKLRQFNLEVVHWAGPFDWSSNWLSVLFILRRLRFIFVCIVLLKQPLLHLINFMWQHSFLLSPFINNLSSKYAFILYDPASLLIIKVQIILYLRANKFFVLFIRLLIGWLIDIGKLDYIALWLFLYLHLNWSILYTNQWLHLSYPSWIFNYLRTSSFLLRGRGNCILHFMHASCILSMLFFYFYWLYMWALILITDFIDLIFKKLVIISLFIIGYASNY